MPDVLASWADAERAQAEQLLAVLASLLAPVGEDINLPPTPEGVHGAIKVRDWTPSWQTPCVLETCILCGEVQPSLHLTCHIVKCAIGWCLGPLNKCNSWIPLLHTCFSLQAARVGLP
jgi:hypothetical protein